MIPRLLQLPEDDNFFLFGPRGSIAHDFGNCEAICFSTDTYLKQIDGIKVFPWKEGIQRYFGNQ